MLLEKKSKLDDVSFHQKINNIPLLSYQYRDSFPSDYVPTLDNDSFAIIRTQLSNRQDEYWIMFPNFSQIMFFADSLGRKKYSFVKTQYERMMREPLQSHLSVSSFYTIHAAFHLFKIRQGEFTEVDDVEVLSFRNNSM